MNTDKTEPVAQPKFLPTIDEEADLDAIDERMDALRAELMGPDVNPDHPVQRFLRWLKTLPWIMSITALFQ